MSAPTGPSEDRLARALLAHAVEPGDPALAEQVTQVGAMAALEHLRRRLPAARSRAEAVDPEAELRRAADLGIRFVIPGDDEWPGALDELAPAFDG